MSTPVNIGAQVVTPTVESVLAACTRARQFIESHHLCLDATIVNYPPRHAGLTSALAWRIRVS